MSPRDIKKINKQLNVSKRDKHLDEFLVEYAGKSQGGYEFLSMSNKHPENDIIAVTKSLRTQSSDFPNNAIAFAKTKNSDYLLMGQHDISVWHASTKQRQHLMLDDVRLNGKVVRRKVNDIRHLFEPKVSEFEAKRNSTPPSDQKIKDLEKQLGLKFRPELKDYFKKYGHVGYNHIILTGISGNEKISDSLTDAIETIIGNSPDGKYPKNKLPLVDMYDGLFIIYDNNTGESTYWEYGQSFDKAPVFKTVDEVVVAALEHEYELNNL